MVVTRNGQSAQPVTLPVTQTAPGLFTNSYGPGQAAVLNQDGLRNGELYAAPRGFINTLFGTGEGQTDPPGVTGQLAGYPGPTPVAPLGVKIGGVDAEIIYKGSAPGEVAGILQLNVRVPPSVQPGPNSVVVTVGNASSRADVTVNVLGPDGRTGLVAYNNTGTTDVQVTVYRPDAPASPIALGTVAPGNYIAFSRTTVGNDWWIQVNSSPLRVISQVCGYASTAQPPYWGCAGTADAPFPR